MPKARTLKQAQIELDAAAKIIEKFGTRLSALEIENRQLSEQLTWHRQTNDKLLQILGASARGLPLIRNPEEE